MSDPEQTPPLLPPQARPAATPVPVPEGEALAKVDQNLETLIDERQAVLSRAHKRRKWFVTALLLLLVGAAVGLPLRSPELRADLKQAVEDIRSGKMSVSNIVKVYRRHIAKLGKRQQMIHEATLAMGVDPATVKDDDPNMLKEKSELIGNFDDSGPAPTMDSPLLGPSSNPDGEVVMSLPSLDEENGGTTDESSIAAAVEAFPPMAMIQPAATDNSAAETPALTVVPAIEENPTTSESALAVLEPVAETPEIAPAPQPPPAVPMTADAVIGATQIVAVWQQALAQPGGRTLRAMTMSRAAAEQLTAPGHSQHPDFKRCLAMIPVIDEKAAAMQMNVSVRVRSDCILSFQQIRFEAGGDRLLDDAARQQVRLLAEAMKQVPEAAFLVESHTCDRETAAAAKPLTERRARRVVDELVRHGVERGRLLALGFGAELPRAANDSDEHRAINRRISICLLAR